MKLFATRSLTKVGGACLLGVTLSFGAQAADSQDHCNQAKGAQDQFQGWTQKPAPVPVEKKPHTHTRIHSEQPTHVRVVTQDSDIVDHERVTVQEDLHLTTDEHDCNKERRVPQEKKGSPEGL